MSCLIVLVVYLLGVIIKFFIELQDLDKFSEIAAQMINPEASDPAAEKGKAKLVYVFVILFGSLIWPLLQFRGKRTIEVD